MIKHQQENLNLQMTKTSHFFFFYDLIKQLILKHHDIGGKLYYNNTRMDVIFTDKRIIKYLF